MTDVVKWGNLVRNGKREPQYQINFDYVKYHSSQDNEKAWFRLKFMCEHALLKSQNELYVSINGPQKRTKKYSSAFEAIVDTMLVVCPTVSICSMFFVCMTKMEELTEDMLEMTEDDSNKKEELDRLTNENKRLVDKITIIRNSIEPIDNGKRFHKEEEYDTTDDQEDDYDDQEDDDDDQEDDDDDIQNDDQEDDA